METHSGAERCSLEIFTLRRAPLCVASVSVVECAVSRHLDPRPAQSSLYSAGPRLPQSAIMWRPALSAELPILRGLRDVRFTPKSGHR
jgi:hypothetical protein